MECPHCGLDLDRYKLVPVASWEPDTGRTSLVPMGDVSNRPPWAGDVAPMAMGMPQFSEATQRKPARAAEPGADVVVPLLQSVVSATIAALLGLGLAIAGHIDAPLVIGLVGGALVVVVLRVFAGTADKIAGTVVIALVCGLAVGSVGGSIEIPWFFPFIAFLTVLAGVWAWRLVDHSRGLWVHQHIVNAPPPAPVVAGPPASYTVHGEFTDEKGAMQRDDFPEPKDKPGTLHRFAQAIDGKRAHFCEADAIHFGYTRALWRDKDNVHGLANRFLIHQPSWAIDRGGRQGLELTGRGESVIRWLAHTEAEYSIPSPAEPASD